MREHMELGWYAMYLIAGLAVGAVIGNEVGKHKVLTEGFHNLSAHFRMRGR